MLKEYAADISQYSARILVKGYNLSNLHKIWLTINILPTTNSINQYSEEQRGAIKVAGNDPSWPKLDQTQQLGNILNAIS